MTVPDGRHDLPPGDPDAPNPLKKFGVKATAAVVGVAGLTALGLALLAGNDSESSESPSGNEAPSVSVEDDNSDAAGEGSSEPDSAEAGGEISGVRSQPGCDELRQAPSFAVDSLFLRSDLRVLPLDARDLPLEELTFCLEPFETVVVVTGVDDVAGVYTTIEGSLGVAQSSVETFVTGFGMDDEGFPYMDHGQCFVGNPGEPFQTKLHNNNLGQRKATTIDVGITGGDLAGFLGVTVTDFDDDENGFVTHHYEASLPDDNAVVEVISSRIGGRQNPWSGTAAFQTTTYNTREYYPYKNGLYDTETSTKWEGPAEYIQVFVLCG